MDTKNLITDKQRAIKELSSGDIQLCDISEDLLNDPDIILASLVPRNGDIYDNVSYWGETLLNDKEFIRKAIQIDGETLYALVGYSSLCEDRELLLLALKNDMINGWRFSSKVMSDKEIVMEMIDGFYGWHHTINLLCLVDIPNSMSYELLHDREVILGLAESGIPLNNCICDDFRSDHEIAYYAVQRIDNGMFFFDGRPGSTFLWNFDENIRDDYEIVLRAVQSESSQLEFASERLRDNDEIVKIAVSTCGEMLEFASERLRDNDEIVKIAVDKDSYVICYASDRIKRCHGILVNDNEDEIRLAVADDGLCLENASERLRDNEDIVKIAVSNNGNALGYASERLRDNEEIVCLAIQNDGASLRSASFRLKDSIPVVRCAVRNFGQALAYASGRLRNDENIVIEAVKNNDNDCSWHAFEYASESLQNNDDFVAYLMTIDKKCHIYASRRLQIKFSNPIHWGFNGKLEIIEADNNYRKIDGYHLISADFLSAEEAVELPEYITIISESWWLKPEKEGIKCPFMFAGKVYEDYTDEKNGFRPVLNILEDLSDETLYSTITISGTEWYIISNHRVLSKDVLKLICNFDYDNISKRWVPGSNDFGSDGYDSWFERTFLTLRHYDCTCTDIVLPGWVKVLDDGLFKNADNIRSVTIPDGLTCIGNKVFYNCVSLESIYLGCPDISFSGGSGNFDGCVSLKRVYFKGWMSPFRYSFDGPGPFEYGANLYINRDRSNTIVIPENNLKGSSFAPFEGVNGICRIRFEDEETVSAICMKTRWILTKKSTTEKLMRCHPSLSMLSKVIYPSANEIIKKGWNITIASDCDSIIETLIVNNLNVFRSALEYALNSYVLGLEQKTSDELNKHFEWLFSQERPRIRDIYSTWRKDFLSFEKEELEKIFSRNGIEIDIEEWHEMMFHAIAGHPYLLADMLPYA